MNPTVVKNIWITSREETYVLKPSDGWGGSDVTNPSYFSPCSTSNFSGISAATKRGISDLNQERFFQNQRQDRFCLFGWEPRQNGTSGISAASNQGTTRSHKNPRRQAWGFRDGIQNKDELTERLLSNFCCKFFF
jgi:hypothetical protein